MLLSGQRSLPLPLELRLGLPLSLLEGLLTPRLRGHAPPLPALLKPPALLLIQRLAIGACGLLCRACRLHRLAVLSLLIFTTSATGSATGSVALLPLECCQLGCHAGLREQLLPEHLGVRRRQPQLTQRALEPVRRQG